VSLVIRHPIFSVVVILVLHLSLRSQRNASVETPPTCSFSNRRLIEKPNRKRKTGKRPSLQKSARKFSKFAGKNSVFNNLFHVSVQLDSSVLHGHVHWFVCLFQLLQKSARENSRSSQVEAAVLKSHSFNNPFSRQSLLAKLDSSISHRHVCIF
jgi:hypothetical protein